MLRLSPIGSPRLTPIPDTYIIALTVLGWIVLAAYGNLSAIDAFFLATSAATVTGLTTSVTQPHVKLNSGGH